MPPTATLAIILSNGLRSMYIFACHTVDTITMDIIKYGATSFIISEMEYRNILFKNLIFILKHKSQAKNDATIIMFITALPPNVSKIALCDSLKLIKQIYAESISNA